MREAPGPDDITAEMLAAAGGRGVMEITNLANRMYSEGRFQSRCINPYLLQYQR